jgi:hypothetical protein
VKLVAAGASTKSGSTNGVTVSTGMANRKAGCGEREPAVVFHGHDMPEQRTLVTLRRSGQ